MQDIAGTPNNIIIVKKGFVGLSDLVKRIAFLICGNECFLRNS